MRVGSRARSGRRPGRRLADRRPRRARTRTGWDPATADVVVGTSAGSVIGSLLRRRDPALVHGRPLGRRDLRRRRRRPGPPRGRGRPLGRAPASGSPRAWPPIGPGSWALALRTVRSPRRYTPGRRWSPAGRRAASSRPSRCSEHDPRVVPSGWTDHPDHWVVACDYATGRRVAFGRDDAPRPSSPTRSPPRARSPASTTRSRSAAAATSTAACTRPRTSTWCATDELDLVICLNPTSSLHPTRAWNPVERLARTVRDASGRRLGSEAKKLRAAGTEVVLIQPTAEDLAVDGPEPDEPQDRNPVIETARRTVGEPAREPRKRELLDGLPAGDERRVRRPEGDRAAGRPDRDPLAHPEHFAAVRSCCHAQAGVAREPRPARRSRRSPRRSAVQGRAAGRGPCPRSHEAARPGSPARCPAGRAAHERVGVAVDHERRHASSRRRARAVRGAVIACSWRATPGGWKAAVVGARRALAQKRSSSIGKPGEPIALNSVHRVLDVRVAVARPASPSGVPKRSQRAAARGAGRRSST